MTTRLDVRINNEVADVLRRASEEDEVSFAETVRRALTFYKVLRDHWKTGGKIILRSADGKQDLEIIQLR